MYLQTWRLTPYLHLNLAQMALDPRGMLTTFRAPLYPALLSRVHYVSGIDDLELRDFTYFYVINSVGLLQPPVLIASLFVLVLPFVFVSLSAAFGVTLLSNG